MEKHMNTIDFRKSGDTLRDSAKSLVLGFMTHNDDCHPNSNGMKQTDIFRECGLDWGDKENASSDYQQIWIVGLLRQLAEDGHVVRVYKRGPWRLALETRK